MTVFSFRVTTSRRAMIALILPVAALLPLTAPLDQAAAMRLGLSEAQAAELAQLGTAQAATRTAKKRVVRKAVVAKRGCTTSKIKGKLVKRCKVVKLAPVPPALVAVPIEPAPPPMMNYAPAPPAPPPAPYIAPPQVSVPAAAYYWIDQADSYANALGNSPPDFTFRYDGVDSWAWVSRSGEVLIVEPGRDGVVQYYFGPRDTAPYLVRDSYLAYGFDGRDLVQIYDNSGRIYTGALTYRQRNVSQDLQDRGRALYAASIRKRRWDGGAALSWGSQFYEYGYNDGWNYGWQGGWRERSDWGRYEQDRYRNYPPRRLDDERRHRRDARHDYDDWRRSGGYGAPPPTGNPIVTPGPDSGGVAMPPRGPRTPPGGAPPPALQQGPAPVPVPVPPVMQVPAPPPQTAPVPAAPEPSEPPRRRPHRDVSEDSTIEDKTLPAGEPQLQSAPPVRAPRQWSAPPAPPPPAPAPAQYEAPYVAPAPPPPPPPPPAPVQYQAPVPQSAPAPAPSPPPRPAPAPAPAPPPAPAPDPEPAMRDRVSSGDSERP